MRGLTVGERGACRQPAQHSGDSFALNHFVVCLINAWRLRCAGCGGRWGNRVFDGIRDTRSTSRRAVN